MIIVTGGAGFIGSNIAGALAARGGGDVVVVDQMGSGDKWRNLAHHELADVIDPDALPDLLAGHEGKISAIIHMGAISSTTETDVDLIVETNFRLSRRLWTWCAHTGTTFIYASSAATYGDGSAGFDDDPSLDALVKLRPLNPYGWSKHLFDRMVLREVNSGGPQPKHWAGLKFFNVYGPNEYHKGAMRSVVHQAFEQIQERGSVRLFRSHHPDYQDGGQLRDFIYVVDCVDLVLWLLDNPGVCGLYNCGTGEARSFLDLAHAVFAAMGREPNVEYIDTPVEIRDRYQYFTQAESARLRAAGYPTPYTSLEDGVRDYVTRYLDSADPYA